MARLIEFVVDYRRDHRRGHCDLRSFVEFLRRQRRTAPDGALGTAAGSGATPRYLASDSPGSMIGASAARGVGGDFRRLVFQLFSFLLRFALRLGAGRLPPGAPAYFESGNPRPRLRRRRDRRPRRSLARGRSPAGVGAAFLPRLVHLRLARWLSLPSPRVQQMARLRTSTGPALRLRRDRRLRLPGTTAAIPITRTPAIPAVHELRAPDAHRR